MTDRLTKLTPDVNALVSGSNQFAVELFSRLANGAKGDLFFSPSSISQAFAIAYAGAAGDTATEIADAFHFTLPASRLHESLRALWGGTKTGGIEFRVANRLWGQQGYPFLTDFLQITQRCYGATLAQVDFVESTEMARLEINDWVSEQTVNKVNDLLPPGSLDPTARLILTNAIYFLGSWDSEFNEDATVDANFWISSDESCPARMMQQTNTFRYGEFDDLQVLEMPYRSQTVQWKAVEHGDIERQEPVEVPDSGSDFVMTILLPRKTVEIRHLEDRLSESKLKEWTTLRSREVAIKVPKFRIESTHFLDQALGALGIQKAFLIDEADFSAMSDDPDGLYIGTAIHKAFVSVNENGTEAAAATAIIMMAGSLIEPEPPKEFIADHPFLFIIRDRKTQLIHFMGRITQPKYQK